MNTIKFYKVRDRYGSFANFSMHSIKLDGKTWRTSEHYFQAMKFKDEKLQEQIRDLESPMDVMLC